MGNNIHYQGDIAEDGIVNDFEVALLDNVSGAARDQLASRPYVKVIEAKQLKDVGDAQGVLIRGTTKFQNDDSFRNRIMYVVRVGVGVNNIDTQLALKNGVATLNTPGGSTNAVARHTQAMMLAWTQQLLQRNAEMQGIADIGDLVRRAIGEIGATTDLDLINMSELVNRLRKPNFNKIGGMPVNDLNLGILGMGRIGQAVTRRSCRDFDTTNWYDPYAGDPNFSRKMRTNRLENPDLVLESSDVVSLHMPLTPETAGIINAERLKRMRVPGLLVNTGRGGLIDPGVLPLLLNKMDDGLSLALDTFPVDAESPAMFNNQEVSAVINHPNCLSTPHVAASDTGTQKNLALEGAGAMIAFAESGIVNQDGLSDLTVSKLSMNDPCEPCTRVLLTIPKSSSIVEIVGSVNKATKLGISNISVANTDKSVARDSTALTAVAMDINTTSPDKALEFMRQLEKKVEVLRRRLMMMTNGN